MDIKIAARDAGTTIIKLVALLLYKLYTKVANVEPEAMQRWEEDLKDLIE